jgi:hypothetical protein
MSIAVIVVAGGERQNVCVWPTYYNCDAGVDHDLIVVHRNMQHVPSVFNVRGNVIYENKCFPDGELPHKAFGAYRHYCEKYINDYEYFAFVSDDVFFKRDNWLLQACEMLDKYDKLGLVATQIFNGNCGQYPHPSHARAPIWFSKSSALKKIRWEFDSDHDGEMRIAYQFLVAGYFSAQIGHKIDFAYDADQKDHIAVLWERDKYGCNKDKYSTEEIEQLDAFLTVRLLENDVSDLDIHSPFSHIGTRNVIRDLQPFDGLLYDNSVGLAVNYTRVERHNFGTYILSSWT